jgi:hypothetical protein
MVGRFQGTENAQKLAYGYVNSKKMCEGVTLNPICEGSGAKQDEKD